jgi:hypothetical protein
MPVTELNHDVGRATDVEATDGPHVAGTRG